jgi:hypothetical protein
LPQAHALACGEPFAFALADALAFRTHRFQALAKIIGLQERHCQAEHGGHDRNRAASNAIMAPYSTTKLTMTVSQILLSNKPDGTCCQAKTDWTIANNGGTKRPCQVLTPGNAALVSTGTIPTGFTASRP